jgi:hypothetical protein
MSKQTAVEWLVQEIHKNGNWIPTHMIDQAKQMEKEQINKTAQDNFYAGQDLANGYKIDWDSSEQYYNETYGGQEEPNPKPDQNYKFEDGV